MRKTSNIFLFFIFMLSSVAAFADTGNMDVNLETQTCTIDGYTGKQCVTFKAGAPASIDYEATKEYKFAENIFHVNRNTFLEGVYSFNGDSLGLIIVGDTSPRALSGIATLKSNVELYQDSILKPGKSSGTKIGRLAISGNLYTSEGKTASIELGVNGSDDPDKDTVGADYIYVGKEAKIDNINLVFKGEGLTSALKSGEKFTVLKAKQGVVGKFKSVDHSGFSTGPNADYLARVFEYDKDRISVMVYDKNHLESVSDSVEVQTMGKLLSLNSSASAGSMMKKVYDAVTLSNSSRTIKDTVADITSLYPVNIKAFTDSAATSSFNLKETIYRRYMDLGTRKKSTRDFGAFSEVLAKTYDTFDSKTDKTLNNLVLGFDHNFNNKNIIVSVGYSYTNHNLVYNADKYFGISNNKITEHKGFINSRYDYYNGMYLQGFVSYSAADYELERSWVDGFSVSKDDIANGSTKGSNFILNGELGYNISRFNGFNFDTSIGFDYINFTGNDFQETTTDNNNAFFSYENLGTNSLLMDVKLRVRYLAKLGGYTLIPTGKLRVQERLKVFDDKLKIKYIGVGAKDSSAKLSDNYSKYASFDMEGYLQVQFNDNISAVIGTQLIFTNFDESHKKIYLALRISM